MGLWLFVWNVSSFVVSSSNSIVVAFVVAFDNV